ncbi:MAG: hypothetical protein ACPL3B_01335 [Fervidobacterium sp.]
MKFYLCEIEHENGIVKIAIETALVRGVSTSFFPGPSNQILGFTQHGNYLYPVVSHSKLPMPVLKYFLVLTQYAFGVTRIIGEWEGEVIEISSSVPFDTGTCFEHLSEYVGIIQCKGDIFYIYNTTSVQIPSEAKIKSTTYENMIIKSAIKGIDQLSFLIIGDKYAISKEKVKTILQSNLVTPFKSSDSDGFVEYKKILPVKKLDEGKFVVISENIAYQTAKVNIVSGSVLLSEKNGKKWLETELGIFEILE